MCHWWVKSKGGEEGGGGGGVGSKKAFSWEFYRGLQVGCPRERANRQRLSST